MDSEICPLNNLAQTLNRPVQFRNIERQLERKNQPQRLAQVQELSDLQDGDDTGNDMTDGRGKGKRSGPRRPCGIAFMNPSRPSAFEVTLPLAEKPAFFR